MQIQADWVSIGVQVAVSLFGFGAGYTALLTKLEGRLVKIETQLVNIPDST